MPANTGKRLWSGLLCAVLALSLCACREEAKASSGTTETPTTSVTATATDPTPTATDPTPIVTDPVPTETELAPTETAPAPTDPEPTQRGITAEDLVGTWISIKGGDEYSPMPGNDLYTNTLRFGANGEFICSDHDYVYWPDEEGAWGWALAGRGYMSLFGVYQVEDGKAIISQMYDDFSDYGDETMTYQILYLDENKLIVDDRWGTYIRMEDFSEEKLEELCNALGVEYAPKVYEDWE